jgi:aquaporin Z
MTLVKRSVTEAIGTFWLIFAGCGSAVLACSVPHGIGYVGVSFAFGLTVMCLAYAIGHVSGCHLNPAVSIGLATGGRFPWKEVPAYIVAQVAGAILGAGMLLKIAKSGPGFDLHAGGFASNGYGLHSPAGYSMHAGFGAEMMLTWLFVMIILGATDTRAPKGFAPIAIGLGLALTNLVGIPVTNAAINPARATGPAFYVHGWALHQLWLFWVAPILGAVLGALMYNYVAKEPGITASVPSTMKS